VMAFRLIVATKQLIFRSDWQRFDRAQLRYTVHMLCDNSPTTEPLGYAASHITIALVKMAEKAK